MRLIIACAALVLALWSTTTSAASEASHASPPAALQLILASAALTPAAPRTFSPVVKVQRRLCSACRETCVQDWKIDCDDSERFCRRQFTRCMRICWEDYCR